MKPIFNIKKMILMGLMLFVSVGVFADNADEEKNSLSRSGNNNLIVSTLENTGMDIWEGEEGTITIVPPAGYTTGAHDIIEGEDNIIIDYNSHGLVIRFIAKKNGQTKLKVTLLAIGGGGRSVEIEITINIKSKKDKP